MKSSCVYVTLLAALFVRNANSQKPEDVNHWEGIECEVWTITEKNRRRRDRPKREVGRPRFPGRERFQGPRGLEQVEDIADINPRFLENEDYLSIFDQAKTFKVKSTSSFCAMIQVPEYTYAQIKVAGKLSKTSKKCNRESVQVQRGFAFDPKQRMEVACKSKKVKMQSIALPSDDEDEGRKIALYIYGDDNRADTFTVDVSAIPCSSKVKGCRLAPTRSPTLSPTDAPSKNPTKSPTTKSPTSSPTKNPTESPTITLPTAPPSICLEHTLAEGDEVTIELEDLRDADETCWKVYGCTDCFIAATVDCNFADSSELCARDSLEMFDGDLYTAPQLGDRFCEGINHKFYSSGKDIFMRMNLGSEPFGPGFSATFKAVSMSERDNFVTCRTAECVQDRIILASQEPFQGGKPEGGIRRPKKVIPGRQPQPSLSIEEMTPTDIIMIEIDSSNVLLTSSIQVPEGKTLFLRPKAPLSQVTLDAGKEVTHIFAGPGSKFIAENINFINGYATATNGGAINSAGTIELKHCTFYGNYAQNNGGAIYLYKSNAIYDSRYEETVYSLVVDSTFLENQAGSGGALSLNRQQVHLKDSKFARNRASGEGSAVATYSGRVSLISGNQFSEHEEPVFHMLYSTMSWLS